MPGRPELNLARSVSIGGPRERRKRRGRRKWWCIVFGSPIRPKLTCSLIMRSTSIAPRSSAKAPSYGRWRFRSAQQALCSPMRHLIAFDVRFSAVWSRLASRKNVRCQRVQSALNLPRSVCLQPRRNCALTAASRWWRSPPSTTYGVRILDVGH